jgi:hypothetical protein
MGAYKRASEEPFQDRWIYDRLPPGNELKLGAVLSVEVLANTWCKPNAVKFEPNGFRNIGVE